MPAIALTACGGSNVDDDAVLNTEIGRNGTDHSQDLTKNDGVLNVKNKFNAARFLGQASLDCNDVSINSLMGATFKSWLNKQMALPLSQSHKNWLIEKGFNVRGPNNSYMTGHGGWHLSLWRKLFSSPDSLRQKMVLAWSELFVVSALGLSNFRWRNFAIANYLDTLEALAFGNYRDVLEAVTLSSAMGTYLNMKGNKKADPSLGRVPDENYAREVMQLFTIGLHQLNTDGTVKLDGSGQPIETYTNEDTQGLAAVFTGWRNSSGEDASGLLEPEAYQHGLPMRLTSSLHTLSAKRFLGVTIPAGTSGQESLKIALDTLFNHPNTAPFVSKHFIQRFVTSNPSPAYVRRVAAVFANNGQGVRGDMGAVIKAVLLDAEARSGQASATFGKLREPMVRLVQWGRTFGAYSTNGLWDLGFTDADTALGQMPMYSPSVFNFFRPGYTPPNTAIAQSGLVAPEFQILTEPTVVNYINFMAGTVNNARAVKVDYTPELEIARNAPALVDRYNLWLAAGQLSEATLVTIKNAIQRIGIPSTGDPNTALRNRIYATITLVMSSPEYLIQK